METEVKGRIRLFNCGGIGTNIAKVFEPDRNKPRAGFGNLEAVYIDTSDSDLDATIPRDAVYLLDKKVTGEVIDGSGKIPLENSEEIANVIKEVLSAHPPLDFNIINSSLSGGSGSVFARLLARELVNRGCNVVLIAVATWGDRVEIQNSLNCVKSYDAIARTAKTPLAMYFGSYGQGTATADVNKTIQEVISGLQVLFSRQNKGMDTKDLGNWNNYTKGTSYEPKLVSLHMIDSDEAFTQIGQVITVASLAAPGVEANLPMIPDYRVRGSSDVSAIAGAPVHFVLAEGQLIGVKREMEAKLKELDDQAAARKTTQGITNSNDTPNANGLFL